MFAGFLAYRRDPNQPPRVGFFAKNDSASETEERDSDRSERVPLRFEGIFWIGFALPYGPGPGVAQTSIDRQGLRRR